MRREPPLRTVTGDGGPEDGDSDPTAKVLTVDKRVPGRRGQVTRRRLLDCTRDALARHPYRDVKVVDIARCAGTSPATFYQYFQDVEHAVLALSDEVALETDRLAERVGGDWAGPAGIETARGVVQGFLEHWERHRPVLRVVELAAEEGDLRFQELRCRPLNTIARALADVVREFQRRGSVPQGIDAMATAGSLVTMLADNASHRYGFEFWAIEATDVEAVLTRIVYWTVTGQTP
jgi:AcrR family transcriptional regulator